MMLNGFFMCLSFTKNLDTEDLFYVFTLNQFRMIYFPTLFLIESIIMFPLRPITLQLTTQNINMLKLKAYQLIFF